MSVVWESAKLKYSCVKQARDLAWAARILTLTLLRLPLLAVIQIVRNAAWSLVRLRGTTVAYPVSAINWMALVAVRQ